MRIRWSLNRIMVVVLGFAAVTAGATLVAQTLPPAELTARTRSARTAADHKALAAHYRAHAAEHEADAKAHRAIVADARTQAQDDHAWELAQAASHYAEHSEEAAEALRDLAALHEGMAEPLAQAPRTR